MFYEYSYHPVYLTSRPPRETDGAKLLYFTVTTPEMHFTNAIQKPPFVMSICIICRGLL